MAVNVFSNDYPVVYLDKANEVSKQLNVVVCIEGVEKCISTVATYTRVRYGDPGVDYGDPGLVYGGLRLDDGVQVGLSMDSSFTISQRLEPEQGRGAVGTITLVFVDLNQEFTRLISPGQTLNDILGNKLIKVYMGYADTSFPDDYFVIFRGYASKTRAQSGKIFIELSDANLKRRTPVFVNQISKTTAEILPMDTVINLNRVTGFARGILGPDGLYDSGVKYYVRINDEIMEYNNTGIINDTQINVTRGARGTIADTHDVDSDAQAAVQIEGNVIDLALKIMLSGWNGPYISDIPIQSIKDLADFGFRNNALRLVDGFDAVEDYGITVGSYVYVTGSTAGNDGTYVVQSILNSPSRKNNIITFTTSFPNLEFPATSVRLAVRSKYDTFPITCGLKMRPTEIDVKGWEDLRDLYFNADFYDMRFFLKDKQTGKEFIEKELLLPSGCYSITRFGKLSVKLTLPPIAGEKIPVLDISTTLDAKNITVERALNNRRFFNEVEYKYDIDDQDEYRSISNFLDTDSLNILGLTSRLPIQSKGLRSDLGAEQFVNRRGINLLNRYKDAAYEITNLKTNWGTGSFIEAGDVIIIKDDGQLQISNLETGIRDLGAQLFEVIDRSVDIKTGQITLKVLSNLGYDVNDRFAVISPSSRVAATGSTVNSIKITDSFTAKYPENERAKWDTFINLPIQIHNDDYSISYTREFLGFSAGDPYLMLIDSPLPIVVDDTFIVDIPYYPDNDLVYDQQLYKTVFCHIDPTVDVLSGISNFSFTVPMIDADKFKVGLPIIVHNNDYSLLSVEAKVQSVTMNTIVVDVDLGFTPSAGQKVELIGFKDEGGPYRII